jgi:Mn2+/Fe2+ NRAMP family transporter
MLLSNLVMFAIIVSTAATLHAHGQSDLNSAADAARALEPLAGRWAGMLFALGFIGSGMLAIPVLAGSGAAGSCRPVRQTFRVLPLSPPGTRLLRPRRCGNHWWHPADLTHVDPVQLLVISAFVNGLAATPFLIIVMLISRDRTLMGKHSNGRLSTILGWITVTLCRAKTRRMARELAFRRSGARPCREDSDPVRLSPCRGRSGA